MAQRSRVVFAAFAISLLLIAAPIDARRVNTHKMKGGEAEELQWWFGTCSRLQDRFAQVSSRGASHVQNVNQTGEVGYTSASRTMFSVWQMARIVRRANHHECAWAEDVDMAPLRQIIHETLSSNPCLPVVESRIQNSAEESVEDQTDVLLSSMGMLMTADCEAQSMTDRPEESVNEPRNEEDVEEEVEELMEDVMGADSAADASLLQVEEGQPQQVAEATFRMWPPPSWMGVDRWLLRTEDLVWNGQVLVEGSTTAINSAGPATAAEWIVHGLGVGAWLVGFTLLCAGAVYLVAFILSALLCLLRSILLVLLGRSTSLKTCLDHAVARVSGARASAGLVTGLCIAGGAALITTTGGVLGVTTLR